MPLPAPNPPSITEPNWRPYQRFTNDDLPPNFRPWLLDDGSLTQRLLTHSPAVFSLRRLRQDWQVPRPSECRLLALPQRQLALVREVVLQLDGCPVVFARSVFPVASLTGKLAHLRKLKNRSLGTILFNHPGMHRSPFELAHLAGASSYLPAALHQQEPCWGRRSHFDIGGCRLMVSEVFLRNFEPWCSLMPVHRSQRGRVSAAIARPKH